MDNLVIISRHKAVTDSLTVADKFKKRHKNVIQKIESIIKDDENTQLNFQPSEYEDSTGRFLKKYIMDRRSFSILCMSFTGKRALEWKIKFYNAFEAMEKALMQQSLQKQDQAWITQRKAGKATRRQETDTIKKFVEYAEAQGSSNARRYYSNITAMENRALFMLEQKFKNFRDVLDLNQLATLTTADAIVAKALEDGMAEGLPYKDIFQLAKDRVKTFGEIRGKTFIPASQQIEHNTQAIA